MAVGKPRLGNTAALAFAEFAGVITADRVVGEALLRDQVVSEERDAFYQTVVIATVAQWINKQALHELVDKERAGKGEARP
jgi:hypothetical protein